MACSMLLCPQPTCAPVLEVGVLRIVHQQVRALGELEAAGPVGVEREMSRPERGLVVRQVAERRAALGDAVAHRGTRVADQRGADGELADLHRAAGHFVQHQLAGQVAQVHREERRREVAHEARAQVQGGGGRPPDVHFHVRLEERLEEAQALDVVHVQVGEQHVHASRRAGKVTPSGRIPVPASSTRRVPALPATSRQEVFPP